jgi:flagellar biosynthetic protein FliP
MDGCACRRDARTTKYASRATDFDWRKEAPVSLMKLTSCIAPLFLLLLCGAVMGQAASGPTPATPPTPPGVAGNGGAVKGEGGFFGSGQLPDLTKRENVSSALQIVILLTVLSLAPALLIMMTSFTRIVIVLSLLRQALGTASLPPNQVLIGLALFMTFLIMGPTWQRVSGEAIGPYMDGKITQQEALAKAQDPIRQFMIGQIVKSDNTEDILLFTRFGRQPDPKKFSEVGTMNLIPAFMLSELKTAFLMGFKIYLPFLIIDMVISAILISMGMMMLPPVLISLPFKLLLFVLVDGWHLITGGLMGSFMT